MSCGSRHSYHSLSFLVALSANVCCFYVEALLTFPVMIKKTGITSVSVACPVLFSSFLSWELPNLKSNVQ